MDGKDLIIKDKDIIAGYLRDAAGVYPASLDALVGLSRPSSEEELCTLLEYASQEQLPVTVAGGQTGVTGAKNATCGGIILSMENMRSVKSREGYHSITQKTEQGDITYALREDKKEAIFPAGVLLRTMDQLLSTEECWYPPNHTEQSALLGGSVATHGTGSRSFGFGATRNYITSLHAALMNGALLSNNRGDVFAQQGVLSFSTNASGHSSVTLPTYRMPAIKNAAGLYVKPDMEVIDLFIGSEGSLGVFTEIGIRVLPRRPIETGLLFFAHDKDAFAFAEACRLHKADPAAYEENPLQSALGFFTLEYFDANALRIAPASHGVPANACAGIEIEYFSGDAATVETLMRLYDAYGAIDSWHGEQIIAFRHSIPATVNEIVRGHGMKKLATDFTVPHEKYREMHATYENVAQEFQEYCRNLDGAEMIHSGLWGHIGDDQVHFNFIPRSERETTYAQTLYLQLLHSAVALGGTVSGEHGVGKKQLEINGTTCPLLWFMYRNNGIEEIRAVKRTFDPAFLLNRGTMVPYR
jgi:D-lactate dehydrogenase (cytochrome)